MTAAHSRTEGIKRSNPIGNPLPEVCRNTLQCVSFVQIHLKSNPRWPMDLEDVTRGHFVVSMRILGHHVLPRRKISRNRPPLAPSDGITLILLDTVSPAVRWVAARAGIQKPISPWGAYHRLPKGLPCQGPVQAPARNPGSDRS